MQGLWQSPVFDFPESGSTMDDAWDAVGRGEPLGTVIIARHQTGGRGRLGRAWTASPGSAVLLSVILPAGDRTLQMAAGALAVQELARQYGVQSGIKWPNDVVAAGRKMAGVLVERRLQGGLDRAVLGIGVNYRGPLPEVDAGALEPVSLDSLVQGPLPPIEDALGSLLRLLEGWLDRVGAEPAVVWGAWRASLETLGKQVTIRRGDGVVAEGMAEDLDAQGRLLVRDAAGRLVPVDGGDVSLRPG